MKKFGIGSPTGIELPAETDGTCTCRAGRDHYTDVWPGMDREHSTACPDGLGLRERRRAYRAYHRIDDRCGRSGSITLVAGGFRTGGVRDCLHADMMQAVTDINSTGWRATVPG